MDCNWIAILITVDDESQAGSRVSPFCPGFHLDSCSSRWSPPGIAAIHPINQPFWLEGEVCISSRWTDVIPGTRLSMSARTVAGSVVGSDQNAFVFAFLITPPAIFRYIFDITSIISHLNISEFDWTSVWSRALRAYFSDEI